MRDFATGLRLVGRAVVLLARAPRLYLLGIVPALVTLVLFGAGFAVLLWQLDDLVRWLTPFADHWSTTARESLRVLGGLAVLVSAGMLGVVGYTAVTLLIGGPFYERLSAGLDDLADRLDDPAAVTSAEPISGWSAFGHGVRDSVLLVGASLACAVPLLLGGFLPLVGQTVVPVVTVGVGSWLLALELVGPPFQRRGMGLAQRRRALRERRLLTLGTAVPAYLLCTIPFTAALMMPVAVASGTLLAREVLAGRAGATATGRRPAPPARHGDGPPGAVPRPGPDR